MTSSLPDLGQLRTALEAVADPERAPQMAAYMKDRFPFLGVAAGPRRQAQRPTMAASRNLTEAQLLELAQQCWAEPEREFQYVATDILRKWQSTLTPAALPDLKDLIETRSWWDTVDGMAAWVVGPLVLRHPSLRSTMDDWIGDPDLWVRRTAILHQLGHKEATDEDRLFRYVAETANETEFFIRKASGGALRQHARIAPDRVRAFVDDHPELSGLTRREARKHLDR